jgi:hypothetical protein
MPPASTRTRASPGRSSAAGCGACTSWNVAGAVSIGTRIDCPVVIIGASVIVSQGTLRINSR